MLLHHARRLARTRTDGSIPERDHLTRQAARLNAQLRN
jgi:hypothetical protein